MNTYYIEWNQIFENDQIVIFQKEKVIANNEKEAIQHVMWKFQNLDKWIKFKIETINKLIKKDQD